MRPGPCGQQEQVEDIEQSLEGPNRRQTGQAGPDTQGPQFWDHEVGPSSPHLLPFTQRQAHASARQQLFSVLGRDYPPRT
jgi:hypothetical protein